MEFAEHREALNEKWNRRSSGGKGLRAWHTYIYIYIYPKSRNKRKKTISGCGKNANNIHEMRNTSIRLLIHSKRDWNKEKKRAPVPTYTDRDKHEQKEKKTRGEKREVYRLHLYLRACSNNRKQNAALAPSYHGSFVRHNASLLFSAVQPNEQKKMRSRKD